MTHTTPTPDGPPQISAHEAVRMLRLALVSAECAIKGREHTGFIAKALSATEHIAATHPAPAGDAVAVLQTVRNALQVANDTEDGPITDTIWMPGARSETLFDFIDEAIVTAERAACVCREPATAGVTHRIDGPCHVSERAATQPAGNPPMGYVNLETLDCAISFYQDKVPEGYLPFYLGAPVSDQPKPAWGVPTVGAVAWAALADRGYIRYWSYERSKVKDFAARIPNCEGVPIIGVPSAAPISEDAGECGAKPVDMILHCPACGLQHIDAPDEWTPDWKNEPHRSHLCRPEDGGRGHIWRPADVPTNGVKVINTKGKADNTPAAPSGSTEQRAATAAKDGGTTYQVRSGDTGDWYDVSREQWCRARADFRRTVPATPAPDLRARPADLAGLTRYMETNEGGVYQHDEGEFVTLADVQALLAEAGILGGPLVIDTPGLRIEGQPDGSLHVSESSTLQPNSSRPGAEFDFARSDAVVRDAALEEAAKLIWTDAPEGATLRGAAHAIRLLKKDQLLKGYTRTYRSLNWG